jgi:hypothetical protein
LPGSIRKRIQESDSRIQNNVFAFGSNNERKISVCLRNKQGIVEKKDLATEKTGL